jgi:hypothetical protein
MGFSRVIGLRVVLVLLISDGFFNMGTYNFSYMNVATRQAKIKQNFVLQSTL